MQGFFSPWQRGKDVLPPTAPLPIASERKILEVLRRRCRIGPDATIATIESDHREIGSCLRREDEARRQNPKR